MSDRIEATYLIETPLAVEQAAESLAGEQSSGTFVAVPGETEELKERSRARVEEITAIETVSSPSLPGALPAKSGYHRARIRVSWPFENIGLNLPTLVATLQGNLYELREFSGLKLLDFELPEAFRDAGAPPRFGVRGTRELTGVSDGPMVGTIVKPSVGLSPEATAELVRELAEAGIDFIKDDELMANSPHSPLAERVKAVMRVVRDHAEKTGKKVMIAFNISDSVDAMKRHHDTVLAEEGTCVMVSLNGVGLSGVEALRRHGELPIHGHRNGWGLLGRHPLLGIEYPAYQKLWRLVGVDHLHVNAIGNKFWEPDDSVFRSLEACRKPFLGGREVLPVLSSGQWGGQVPDTYEGARTTDVLYVAGGGIMAHPDGPPGGLRAIRQAWQATIEGISLEEYAKTHPELARSLEKFGGGRS